MRRPRVAAFVVMGFVATTAARAEVSVDRPEPGRAVLFFEPGPNGPWERVRPDTPSGDLLNEAGHEAGHGWPVAFVNARTDLPEVVWSTGGVQADVHVSWHDGSTWQAVRNLSQSSADDKRPAAAGDAHGNRFVAWTRSSNGSHSVQFTAVAGDDGRQTSVKELSRRLPSARVASVAVHGNVVYVAYEERPADGTDGLTVVIDRASVERRNGGYVVTGVAGTIDIARVISTCTSHPNSEALARPRVRSESGHVWMDWRDGEGRLGHVVLGGDDRFSEPSYREFDPGGEDAARAEVRHEVLGL